MCLHEFVGLLAKGSTQFDVGEVILCKTCILYRNVFVLALQILFAVRWCSWFFCQCLIY